MTNSPNLLQDRFRVRTDTGAVNSTPTWAAAENTNVSLAVETTFCIRFTVSNTGSAAGAGPYIIRVSKNAGAYTAVTTSTGATLGAQSEATASSDADETAIPTGSFRLTVGTGTASAGVYDETGSATKSLTNGLYTELEYGLILKTAGAVAGDTFDFRLYNSTTAFNSYTQTPRITAIEPSGTDFQPKASQANGALASGSDYNAAGHTTFAITTTENCASGDLVIVLSAADNSSTVDGTTVAISSMADSAGNTYTGGRNQNFGSPGAQAGVNAAVWYCRLISALPSGGTITATYSSSASRGAVALVARSFAMPTGKGVANAANTGSGVTSATPPVLSPTTTNEECLRVRANGAETNVAQGFSTRRSSGFAYFSEATANSGTAATSVTVGGEWTITTGTAASSSPSALAGSVDQAGAYVALKALPIVVCLANDVSSASSVSQPTAATGADTEDDCLANDVSSASSVTQPAVQQEHAPLANDIKSNSSVTQPAVKQLHGLLANDVSSASSVSQPNAVIFAQTALLANDVLSASSVTNPAVQQRQVLLANDVLSASSVTQPAAKQLQGLLANDISSASSVTKPTQLRQLQALLASDVLSASSVSQPAAVIGRTLLANDVLSASSVTQPAAGIQRVILANDVISASKVSNPIVGIVGVVQGRDLISASSVTQPAVKSLHGLLADDVKSASNVSQPVALILRTLAANDVISASSVSQPAVAEITAGQPLANDIVSASFVSTPTLVVEGGVIPVPPEVGGGGKVYGRGYPRKRWEELLRLLEEERQAALRRAQAFPSNKDRQKARKAARAASQAIAAALEAADEAAEVAHAGAITRSLEAAAEAKGIAEYLEQMRKAREAAIEMELDDDDEAILMMVA